MPGKAGTEATVQMVSSGYFLDLRSTKKGHSPSAKVSDFYYLLLGIYPRETVFLNFLSGFYLFLGSV